MSGALCDQEGAIGFHGKIRKSGENRIYGEKNTGFSNLHSEVQNFTIYFGNQICLKENLILSYQCFHFCSLPNFTKIFKKYIYWMKIKKY